jgi:hypothetical protein
LARLHVPTGGGAPIDSEIRQLDWSPDSRKFVGVVGSPSDVYLANAPGGEIYDEYRITNTPSVSEANPTWSPDGNKLSYNAGSAVMVADSDGSGATQIATGAGVADWQPVHTPSSYIRPKGASPIYASFVTAFEPCTTSNRTHGPPLAHASCNPPVPESPNLTVSAGETQLRSIGSLRIRVLAGVPGGPDDTDVQLSFSLTNVMKASDFSEYSGEVGVRIPSRVTDRESPASSTLQDFPLSWSVPCAPTADPQLASACALNTTLDAVMPGAAAEGTRAIWAFDAIEVHDGGPDGNADSPGDNSPFLKQGIFVP